MEKDEKRVPGILAEDRSRRTFLKNAMTAGGAAALATMAGLEATTARAEDAPLKVLFLITHSDEYAARWSIKSAYFTLKLKLADEVRFAFLGKNEKLLVEDKEINEFAKKIAAEAKEKPVACILCADEFGVSDQLREMGFTVTGYLKPVMQWLREGYIPLTY